MRNLETGQRVVVRINDRGPFVKKRIIDLSRSAAQEVGILAAGTGRVALYLLPGDVLPPPVAADPVTIQVAAFHEAERAEALVAALGRAFRQVKVVTDGIWYRVQIGSFEGAEEAEPLRRELEERGYGAILVPLDVEPEKQDAEAGRTALVLASQASRL